MSSRSRGLNRYAEKHFGPNNVNAKRQFGGDVNTSLIMTEKGITVTLNHDTQLPRPYSDSGDTKIPLMVQRLQGTEGIFFGSMEKIYIDGRSPLHRSEVPRRTMNNTSIFCGGNWAMRLRARATEAKTLSSSTSSSGRSATKSRRRWMLTMRPHGV